MQKVSRAALAAALLNCVSSAALAQTDPHWLTDTKTGCAVFDANAGAGDAVNWSGACEGGLASGKGTASFTSDGAVTESFTGTFAEGVAQDGPVVVRWGKGWVYEGNSVGGQFSGAGILTNDRQDRFEGNWTDGKMSGHGTLTRASGERYDGEWKNDRPHGTGVLTRADGNIARGIFADGRLVADSQAEAPLAAASPAEKTAAPRGFASLAGKTLTGIDGSRIALTPIEGGIERQITATGGVSQKTTFTFMNERLGTVVEDGVANVTGFFRLTETGVDVRYADGRAEMLTASEDGGVLLSLVGVGGDTACPGWYPDGHVFSEADRKAALAAYASKLGLRAADTGASCPSASAPARAAETRPQAKAAPAPVAFQPRAKMAELQPVAVRESVVRTIDLPLPAASSPPAASLPAPVAGRQDASRCLKVESDGLTWGFRNECGFPVQFAYCLLKGGASLTACDKGSVTNSVTGSVAANGFGALSADRSFSEKDTDHNFRWVACDGGAGEVVARLESAEPPSGRCERATAITASAQ